MSTVLCAMLVGVVARAATTFTVDGLTYTVTDATELTVSVSSGSSASGAVTIPSTVTNGGTTYTVTAIDGDAFYYNTAITSLVLPSTVTSVGEYAFGDCEALASITLAEGLTLIDDYGFSGTAITELTTPASLVTIGANAFSQCTSLTTVTFAEGLTTLESQAFIKCKALTSVTLPEGVTSIGASCFETCTALASLSLPSTLTSLGSSAFYECTALTEVDLTPCTSLTAIPTYLFSECSALAKVSLPATISSCGNYAFTSNTVLANVYAYMSAQPSGASKNVFDSSVLESATLHVPGGCASAYGTGYWAFTTITEDAGDAAVIDTVLAVGDVIYKDDLAYVVNALDGYTGALTFSSNQPEGDIVIPSTVTYADYTLTVDTIATAACNLAKSLTSVTIPNTVKYIGAYGFRSCSALTSVTMEDGDEALTLATGVFTSCSALTSVSLPGRLSEIPSSMFSFCTSLADVTLTEGITYIGQGAFQGCTALTSVTIPGTISVLNGFQSCTGLTSVTLKSGLTEIENYAFNGCTALTSITLPEGLTTISGFMESGLTTLTLPSTVTTVGDNAFYGCTALESVTLNEGLTSIGEYAFGQYPLTDIALPSTLTSIGNYAFSNGALTTLDLPDAVTTLGLATFNSNAALTTIDLSASLASIGVMAFDECDAVTSVVAYTTELPTVTGASSLDSDDQDVLFSATTLSTATLTVPEGCSELYAASSYWAFTTIEEDVEEPSYCVWDEETYPRVSTNGRTVLSITIDGATVNGESVENSVTVNESTSSQTGVYIDCTADTVSASIGDEITIDMSDVSSMTWMHYYAYIDYNHDYSFSENEYVSYTHYCSTGESGTYYNSLGVVTYYGTVISSMPVFTIPTTALTGPTRMRVKVDWNSLDPCGNSDESNLISNNGGSIIDFVIDINEGVLTTNLDIISIDPTGYTSAAVDTAEVEYLYSLGNITLGFDETVYVKGDTVDITLTDGVQYTWTAKMAKSTDDDNAVTLAIDDPITWPGTIIAVLPEGVIADAKAYGSDYAYGKVNAADYLYFFIAEELSTEAGNVTIDPAEGVVDSLTTFALTFDDWASNTWGVAGNDRAATAPYVADADGNVVATGTIHDNYTTLYASTITLDSTVTEPGDYTLVVLPGCYYLGSYSNLNTDTLTFDYTIEEPTYCIWDDEAYPRSSSWYTSRIIASLAVTGATSGGDDVTFSTTVAEGVTSLTYCYFDNTADTLNASIGDELTITVTPNDSFSWMHFYAFVDYNQDLDFDDDGECVSYTAYSTDGEKTYYNSLGESVSGGDRIDVMPAFTIPTDALLGATRIRFKCDWNSLDPCGNTDSSNLLSKNGGSMVDFIINIGEQGLQTTLTVTAVDPEDEAEVSELYEMYFSVDADAAYVNTDVAQKVLVYSRTTGATYEVDEVWKDRSADNVIGIAVTEAITDEGWIVVSLPEALIGDLDAYNSSFTAGYANAAAAFYYNIVAEEDTIEGNGTVTIDPEEGTVDSLSVFTITFEDYTLLAATWWYYPYLTDESGETVYKWTFDDDYEIPFDWSTWTGSNYVTLTLPETVTAAGTYTLVVPDSVFNFEDDPEKVSAAMEFVYTIDETTGISTVDSDTDDDDTPTYNIAGQRVSATTKGILIRRGKKVINK